MCPKSYDCRGEPEHDPGTARGQQVSSLQFSRQGIERMTRQETGLARLDQLRDAFRIGVESLARSRYTAFAAKLGWPAWEDMGKNDESGEGAEYRIMYLCEAEQDLLDALAATK
jgi:hypothetical protein